MLIEIVNKSNELASMSSAIEWVGQAEDKQVLI